MKVQIYIKVQFLHLEAKYVAPYNCGYEAEYPLMDREEQVVEYVVEYVDVWVVQALSE